MASIVWSDEALTVLGVFRRGRKLHFYAVVSETGFGKSTVHHILRRLVHWRMLDSERERIDPALTERQPRTLYQITDEGMRRKRKLRAMLA